MPSIGEPRPVSDRGHCRGRWSRPITFGSAVGRELSVLGDPPRPGRGPSNTLTLPPLTGSAPRPHAPLASRLRRILRGSEHNLLARSLTLNVGGRILGLLTGFASSVLLARVLGPADRGLLALMISASTVALAVAAVGQPAAVTYYASRRDARPAAIVGNVVLQALIIALVVVPLTFVLHRPIADALGRGQGGMVWLLAAALVPITFLDWTTSNQLLGMLRFGAFNAIKFVAGVGYTLAVVLLLSVFHTGVVGGLIATAVASLIAIVGCAPLVSGRRRPSVDAQLMRGMLQYGWKAQVGVVFQMVNYRLDVIVMQLFRPLYQVGYYVIAQTVAEFVITIATGFQSSLLPLVAHYEGQDRQRAVTTTTLRHFGILSGIAVLGNAFAGSAIIYFVYGPRFQAAVAPMLALLPGIWFLGIGLVVQSDLGGRGQPGLSSKLSAMAAAVTVALDVVLIPPLGVMGGALASVAAYTTFGIASLLALRRVSSIPVREMLVPTRADLSVYTALARRLLRAGSPVRGARLGGPAGTRAVSRAPEPSARRRPPRESKGSLPAPIAEGLRSAAAIRPHSSLALYGAGLALAAAMVPLLRSPTMAFASVALLVGGLIAWRSPAIPLALCGVPPLVDAVVGHDPLPSGGFTFLFSAWITVAVAFALMRGDQRLARRSVILSVPVLASFALLGLMLVRVGVSPDQAYGSTKVQLYTADVLIILVGAVFVGTRRAHLNLFVLVLLATDASGALLFLYKYATGATHALFNGRFSLAAAEYPIDMGRASAEGLLVAIFTVIAATGRRARYLAMAAIPALGISLVAAGSRGPIVAFTIALLCLLALSATQRRARRRLLLVAGVLFVAACVVPLIVPSSTLARALSTIIGSTNGVSSNGRYQLWSDALALFSQHLWLGAGTGAGATLVPGLLYPHNLFLEISVELGVVGLTALLLALGGFVHSLRRCWTLAPDHERLVTALVVAMFANGLVNAQFSDPIQGNFTVWLWGGIAVGMAARLSNHLGSDLAIAVR